MTARIIKFKQVTKWRLKSKNNCNYINIKKLGNNNRFVRDVLIVLLRKITKDNKLELTADK